MPTTDRRLTHLSLFSGIGGLDLAAEWAGFETVGQCEWADYPTKVLERHWPNVPRWRDIRTLTGDDFYDRTGLRTVDVISGGFPCQPFSLAGKRRGTADDRYLWPEMLRVISEIRPTWVIGENVAGLVSMVKSVSGFRVESRSVNRLPDADYYEAVLSRPEDALLISLIGDLECIGYAVQAFIIPACAVGAPHRRDRIAIVAYSNGKGLQGSQFRRALDARRKAEPRRPVSQRGQIDSNGLANGDWWSAEPDMGRVAYGVPARVDRLKCLGNAVVPQQFYSIFQAIAEVERCSQ